MKRTRILVADGVTVFRGAVVNLLVRERDFDVLEAANLAEVMYLAREEPADIALVDLQLPPVGGLQAIRALRKVCDADVIVWSFNPDWETVFESIRAGASGYLHKEISPDGLVRALRGAARGEAPLSRELMALMIDAVHALENRVRVRDQAGVLSTREREVLGRVAAGARNREIANELAISEFTVKRHMQNILHKLGVRSRREAAAFYDATVMGVITEPTAKGLA